MDKADGKGFSPAGIKDKDVLHSWVSTTQLVQRNSWSSVIMHTIRN